MGERCSTVPNIEEFWQLGGQLNQESFDVAVNALSKTPVIDVFKDRCSLGQAENMASFAKISISPEQTSLYIFLRESDLKNEPEQEKEPEFGDLPLKRRTVPKCLSDQEILANVLLLTGDVEKYNNFTQVYKNIFK